MAWERRGRNYRAGGAYVGAQRFVLWGLDFWGCPVGVAEYQLDPRPGSRFPWDLGQALEGVMLKRKELMGRAGAGAPINDEEFKKEYPTLYDYLTQTKWEDGSERQTSTLGIYPDQGTIRVMLRDRAMGVCCWVAVTSFLDIFTVVEAALRDPTHEWRADRAVAPTAARKPAPTKALDSNGRKR